MILDLTDVKTVLRIDASFDDDDILAVMRAAESAWTDQGLPGGRVDRTDALDSGQSAQVAVHCVPVMEVTAITEGLDAAEVPLSAVHVGESTGILTRVSGRWRDPVTVTYAWGYADPPPGIPYCLMQLTKLLWSARRVGGRRSGAADDDLPAGALQALIDRLAQPYRTPL